MALVPLKLAVQIEASHDGAGAADAFARAADAGFTAVHLVVRGQELSKSFSESCLGAARRVGVTIVSYGPGWQTVGAFVDRAQERVVVQRRMVEALDAAAWLGAHMVSLPVEALSSGRHHPSGTSYDDLYFRALENLLEIRFEAQKRAMIIGCPVPSEQFLCAPLETREFLDRINSPWVRAQLDVARAAQYSDPCDWIRALGHRMAAVLVDEDILQGEIELYRSIAPALRQTRFDHHVILCGVGDLATPYVHAIAMLEADAQIARK